MWSKNEIMNCVDPSDNIFVEIVAKEIGYFWTANADNNSKWGWFFIDCSKYEHKPQVWTQTADFWSNNKAYFTMASLQSVIIQFSSVPDSCMSSFLRWPLIPGGDLAKEKRPSRGINQHDWSTESNQRNSKMILQWHTWKHLERR